MWISSTLFASIILVSEDYHLPIINDYLLIWTCNRMKQPASAIATTVTPSSPLLDQPFWFFRKLKKISASEIKSFTRQNSPDSKVFGFKVPALKFWIENLRTHDQTGEFLFRIRPCVCKRQNESGTKTFRIGQESCRISSSVNLG